MSPPKWAISRTALELTKPSSGLAGNSTVSTCGDRRRVDLRHLEFRFKVADRAHAPQDGLGPGLTQIVHQQAAESIHPHVGQMGAGAAQLRPVPPR